MGSLLCLEAHVLLPQSIYSPTKKMEKHRQELTCLPTTMLIYFLVSLPIDSDFLSVIINKLSMFQLRPLLSSASQRHRLQTLFLSPGSGSRNSASSFLHHPSPSLYYLIPINTHTITSPISTKVSPDLTSLSSLVAAPFPNHFIAELLERVSYCLFPIQFPFFP